MLNKTKLFVRVADLPPLQQNTDRSKMVLSKIIHGVKSSVTRKINAITGNKNIVWQRSFYDHVVRNDRSLENIREYIVNNPVNWAQDEENPEYHRIAKTASLPVLKF